MTLLLGGRNWRDQIRTDMPAIDTVRNTRYVGLRQGCAQEIEFAGAGVSVAESHSQNGAVVLSNDEAAILAQGEIGQVAILIQDVGDHSYPLGEAETHCSLPCALQAAFRTSGENAFQELRVFVLHVFQEFVGEFSVGTRKEGIASGGQGVDVSRSAGSTTFRNMGKQPLALKSSQRLAGATQGHTQL